MTTQAELIATIAERTAERTGAVAAFLDAFVEATTRRLCQGETVKVTGLGIFSPAAKAATAGRNPRTGEAIAVPARTQAKFKPAKALRDALNSAEASPAA